MRAGLLRHRVTITANLEVKTAQFGFTSKPVVIAKRAPAFVEPLSGRELERALQINPRSTHSVLMRFHAGVKAGQTLTYHDGRNGDRPFEIVAPMKDTDMNHREMMILCKEAAA